MGDLTLPFDDSKNTASATTVDQGHLKHDIVFFLRKDIKHDFEWVKKEAQDSFVERRSSVEELWRRPRHLIKVDKCHFFISNGGCRSLGRLSDVYVVMESDKPRIKTQSHAVTFFAKSVIIYFDFHSSIIKYIFFT